MCYAEVEDVTTDGVVEDSGVEGDDILGMVGVRGLATERLCE